MRLNHKQIAACTGGSFVVEPLDPRALATGLTWDSRDAKPGDVYVALPGERVDGHDFVGAALSGGAVCALVMQPLDEAVRMLAAELGASVIEVPDTAHAVADIAREWRSHLHGRVIALTGSTGKTTTKNLVRDVLASTLSTVATAGNQNNELGVPKTLLAAEQDTQAVVVEMGMRGAGQLADLCDYVRPDWGLVVNVGESHIELLGSRENIARAKAELLCALPEGTGRAFVNADDDYADFVREHARLDARRVETVLFDGSAAAAERRADIGDQRADVRPLGTVHIDCKGIRLYVARRKIDRIHRHGTRGTLHLDAPTRQLVKALSVHTHRGIHRRRLLTEHRAGDILRVRRYAQLKRCQVPLVLPRQDIARLCGAAEKKREHARRHRIERPRVAHAPLPRNPAQLCDDVK